MAVYLQSKLKFIEQCKTTVNEADNSLGIGIRYLKYIGIKTVCVVRRLFNAIVRPHVEYAV